jgi:hypothetical protein|tara:strand:- start:781 stop:1203 length:423 start_codon:yes stop_codon:yes gene_type:complete
MLKLYSNIIENKLLHMIYYEDDLDKTRDFRFDVAPEEQFIQVSALKLEAGKTFRPHKHIWKEAPEPEVVAQESWCVMKGRVKAHFYDLDDSLLGEYELSAGDISLTFEGGHSYTILEDAKVYEYKTGPYQGVEKDKVFLE